LTYGQSITDAYVGWEESLDPAKAQQNTRRHELRKLQEQNERKSANASFRNL
jgi:hypothetical protein